MNRGMKGLSLGLCAVVGLGVSSAAWAQPEPAPATDAPQRQSNTDSLPSFDDLMKKMINAVGGEEAISKIETYRFKGEISTEGEESSTFEGYWRQDDSRIVHMTTPNPTAEGETFKVHMGVNGEIAWQHVEGMPYNVIEPEQARGSTELVMMQMQVLRLDDLVEKHFGEFTTVGQEQFEGKNAYKVRFTSTDGNHEEHFFFEKESGLPMGRTFEQNVPAMQNPDGSIQPPQTVTIKSIMSDWKSVGGVKVFQQVTMTNSAMPDMAATLRFSDMEVNEVEDGAFEIPAQVQKIVDARKNSDGMQLEDFPADYQALIKEKVAEIEARTDLEGLQRDLSMINTAIDQMPASQQDMMRFLATKIRERIEALQG